MYRAYKKDGVLFVIHPVENSRRKNETREEWLERVLDCATPEGVEFKDVETLPDRSLFRNAWDLSDDGIIVNMEKAREIHMNDIRFKRNKILNDLDLDYMRADENSDTTKKNQIKQKKQRLRDLPQTFDLTVAATPEQLKDLWPAELS